MEQSEPPLVVIVGPTASGKTSLSIDIAEKIGGEIVCADSRTVYRGLDIGSAKPQPEDRARVPHWGLDIVAPNERFTVVDFQRYASQVIRDIRGRGKIPILVGGTGLYIDSILYDYEYGGESITERVPGRPVERGLRGFHDHCTNNYNKSVTGSAGQPQAARRIDEDNSINGLRFIQENSIVVGLAIRKNILRTRIIARADIIFNTNIVEETTSLYNLYDSSSVALTGSIYPLIKGFTDGNMSKIEAKNKFVIKDMQLAKRQMTWFRRNPYIVWQLPSEAKDYILKLV